MCQVSGLNRALSLGQPSRHDNRRDHCQARFKFKKMTFTWFFYLNRKTTKRQNDKRQNNETCSKRLICQQNHDSGTVPICKQSFFCFKRELRRFVVSIARRVKNVFFLRKTILRVTTTM